MKFLGAFLVAVLDFGAVSGVCAFEAARKSVLLDFDSLFVWKQRSASAKRLYRVVQEPYQL